MLGEYRARAFEEQRKFDTIVTWKRYELDNSQKACIYKIFSVTLEIIILFSETGPSKSLSKDF